MKKSLCILFAVVFVMGLFMVTANAQATEEASKIKLSGLIEVGGAWIDWDSHDPAAEDEDASDLCLTTVELTAEAEVNEWVNVVAVLLYEDATLAWSGEPGETTLEIDEAIVTIGNTEKYPLYVSAGKMYVPFGALFTHFPDDPLMNAPVTLLLGETLEKALLVGVKHAGLSVSAYVFNGDVDETGQDNHVESYGFDANYSVEQEDFDLVIGASYISNIADADYISEELATDTIVEYIEGFDAYIHIGVAGFFVEGEYMTALDDFAAGELAPGPVEPEVWNIEAGYNLDWGKNLEIVLKYAGSDECGEFIPEDRYGICFNQTIFEDVIVSLGYLNDEYESNDEADIVFAQLAIEF